MQNYDLLIRKLDGFVRKYYMNRLLRGLLIFCSCLLLYCLLLTVGEYYFYFPVWLKVTTLLVLLFVGLSALIWLVIIPLLKMRQLGKVISHEQAAAIIGKHFPEVSDKLLNILQLQQQATSSESRMLIEASIQQKSEQIVLVPFAQAIDLRKNRKYLPYLLAPLLVVVFLLLAAPNLFRDASLRLMQPTQHFQPPAPFAFFIENKTLQVPLYGQLVLRVRVKGSKFPDKVYLKVGAEQVEMQANGKDQFEYTFAKVVRDVSFYLTAAGVNSPEYTVTILEQPRLSAFSVDVRYPAYTGRKEETLQSLGDMQVPQGTVFQWHLTTTNTDSVYLRFGLSGAQLPVARAGKQQWQTSMRLEQDTAYRFILSNSRLGLSDSFHYQVQVIPDQHPQVALQQLKDSLTGQQVLLTGNASDDYGLSRLYFHYTIQGEDKKVIKANRMLLKTGKGKVVPVQQYFDFGSLHLLPGQQVQYFVEAWDNDAVHGSKSGRSELFSFQMPRQDQLQELLEKNAAQINQGLSTGASQSEKIREEVKSLQNELLQADQMSWEQQQGLKSLAEKQAQLNNQVAAVKERFEAQMKNTERKEYSQDIQEKQAAVKEQLDHLLDKQLAEQLAELQKMMQQLNKESAFQQLQQMEQENKLFNMDLERVQELMKQLELQMQLEEMAGKLQQLAEQEGQLKKKTETGAATQEALHKEQSGIRKEMESLMDKEMKALEQANDQQQNPKQLDDTKEKGQEAIEQMEQSSKQLQQNQQQKAAQSQSKAQQQMQQMAESMMQMAAGGNMEQIELDIKATRQLLTNLIRLSFDQEQLMYAVKRSAVSSPLLLLQAQEQKRLSANAGMIKDSLFVLSKRVFQLAPAINKETTELERNMGQSVKALGDRRLPEAVVRQQYAMTHTNNLALLLNELLENLIQQQSMAAGSAGAGKPKPGQGGAGQMMKDIITGQQQLGEGMQPGQGSKQPGGKGQQGKEGSGASGEGASSEQIARMAQQQAALRRQIQALSSLLNSKGMNGNARELKAIQEQMDKNESDMVNKKFNAELRLRQRDIMTRLLKAEKAIRDQEEDNKRSAQAGKDESRPMPPDFKQYLQAQQQMLELYKTVPPSLKPFYKKMAETYLKEVQAGR